MSNNKTPFNFLLVSFDSTGTNDSGWVWSAHKTMEEINLNPSEQTQKIQQDLAFINGVGGNANLAIINKNCEVVKAVYADGRLVPSLTGTWKVNGNEMFLGCGWCGGVGGGCRRCGPSGENTLTGFAAMLTEQCEGCFEQQELCSDCEACMEIAGGMHCPEMQENLNKLAEAFPDLSSKAYLKILDIIQTNEEVI